jgi:hypothetical protein
VFHHDGPFDACNPHRNRKKDVRAPMQAFPADSANNALGGSGPLNKNIDLDRFHGRGEDAFNDYSQSRIQPITKTVQAINPTDRVEQIHTTETYGLGTSTFLDGAPASRKALERRESESEPSNLLGGGLSRKKSLAVRLRGLSQNRNAVTSPDGNGAPSSPGQVQSAGGRARIAATTKESNPFFNEYNDAYEKKGASIRYAEETKPSRVKASSSPPQRDALTRSLTADSAPAPPANEMPEKSSVGGGFLNRMKSLKGGRRARPERRESGDKA